jgi:CRP-like cAMP-binding protein
MREFAAAHDPNENRILSALAGDESRRLLNRAYRVELRQRQVLYEPGAPITHVYFPLTAAAVLLVTMKDGATVAVEVIGREGLVGLPVFWGVPYRSYQVTVLIRGMAVKVPAEALKAASERGSSRLNDVLLSYNYAHVAQLSQTSACNCLHSVSERLARLLLVTLDSTASDELPVTHELLSQVLGVRRPGVTTALDVLRDSGFIDLSRGRVRVSDRKGLESTSCECYKIIGQSLDRYLSYIAPAPPPDRLQGAALMPTQVGRAGGVGR